MDIKKLFIEELNYNYVFKPVSSPEVSDRDKIIDVQIAFEKQGVNIILVKLKSLSPEIEKEIIKKLKKDYPDSAFLITDDNEEVINLYTIKFTSDRKEKIKKLTYDKLNQKTRLFNEKIRFFEVSEDITGRLSLKERIEKAFDTEKVTKKFFTEFQKYHNLFLNFIQGIPVEKDKEWYASVLLNRLMFIYFIQKKGFIDNNPDYLKDRFYQIKAQKQNYYKDFLLPLFFNGFAKRDSAFQKKFGNVPYLNGGLFLPHEIERRYSEPQYAKDPNQLFTYADMIQEGELLTKEAFEEQEIDIQSIKITIENDVFKKLIDYFDGYIWYLDDRPLRNENEINPDILGYIFEKYINQKEMGAYYTKEDITEYICKNTIIPFIFDQLRIHNLNEMIQELKLNITDYVFEGIENRESRIQEIKQAYEKGEFKTINDFITYNLDIIQFTIDFIKKLKDEEKIKRLYFDILKKLTILDPTCGSGAFLFAILNILIKIYETTIDKFNEFKKLNSKYWRSKFEPELMNIKCHPNESYFILKTIIVHNLFGVDIMEEAVEICKLRLFLKIVSQIEDVEHLEPLPDIDFNIKAGNTLIGITSLKEIERKYETMLDYGGIKEKIRMLDLELEKFRQEQLKIGDVILRHQEFYQKQKRDIQDLLNEINLTVNKDLQTEYGIAKYDEFIKKYKPFNWYVEFNEIMSNGGFDVIVGNPPYVEYAKVRKQYQIKGYKTEKCGNLYAFVIERSLNLLKDGGRFGMIVPMSSVCTDRMLPLKKQLIQENSKLWVSNFAVRPGKLFDGVDMNLSIIIILKANYEEKDIYSTNYKRWLSAERDNLFVNIRYIDNTLFSLEDNLIPKFGHYCELNIYSKLKSTPFSIKSFYDELNGDILFFHSGGRYWRKALFEKLSSHYKEIKILKKVSAIIFCILNSQLFYWYWISHSNCFDLVLREVEKFPVKIADGNDLGIFEKLRDELLNDYYEKSKEIKRSGSRIKTTELNIYPANSKPIIDQIDRELAKHYGFTEEELDFIINYDIKYRMGRG